jgi:hypothetical protein
MTTKELKQQHIDAGLDQADLSNLDSPPPRRKPTTVNVRGRTVSID